MNTSTVDCPHCKKPNHTIATKCWKCNEPLDVQKLLKEQISRQYRCPRCHSDDTSSYEMIYQSGTSTGKFSSLSYNNNVGLISTGGKSTSQSLLAQQLAPPKKSNDGGGKIIIGFLLVIFAVAIFFTFVVGGLMLGGLIFGELDRIGIVVIGIISAVLGIGTGLYFLKTFSEKLDSQKDKKAEWQNRYEEWQDSWMCLKCGNSWLLNQSSINKSFK